MQPYEVEYAYLVKDILDKGDIKQGRNGKTAALFGTSITVPVGTQLPLIQGRRMYPSGIIGEFAAIIRGPKNVDDFKKWGCNYWDKWAGEDGTLAIDYGNAWFDFDGYDQVAALKEALRHNPDDRRMIINSWRPHKLKDLSLPCCHYSYQFYVSSKGVLNMVWTQRSADMMIGVPSDFVLGSLLLITLANEFGYYPGYIKFDLGDSHVYEEHWDLAKSYLERVFSGEMEKPVYYSLLSPKGAPFEQFTPDDLLIGSYQSFGALNFLLKE